MSTQRATPRNAMDALGSASSKPALPSLQPIAMTPLPTLSTLPTLQPLVPQQLPSFSTASFTPAPIPSSPFSSSSSSPFPSSSSAQPVSFMALPASALPDLPPLTVGRAPQAHAPSLGGMQGGAELAFLAQASAQRPDEGALLAVKAMRELGVRTEIAGIETAPLPEALEAARPRMVFADGDNVANIVHGESKVSVEDVLDVLADAVMAIVLFQIEADENESHLVSTKLEGLVQACTFFAQLARQKAELWEESEEAGNKQLMLQSSDKMREVVFEISKQLRKLQDDQYDQEAKEELMFRCREVMETTVALLEMSDRYDIRKILRLSAKSRADALKLSAVAQPQQFEAALHAFIQGTTSLSHYLDQRISYLADPVMATRLSNCNADIRQLPESLVHATLACLSQQPLQSLQQQQQQQGLHQQQQQALRTKEELHSKLLAVLDDADDAVCESQRRMFAGVLMDLEPIQRNNVVVTEPDDPSSASSVLGHFEGLLGQAVDALSQGSAGRAGQLLRQGGHWLDQLAGMAALRASAMSEGPARDLLGESVQRLRQALDSVVGVAAQLRHDPQSAALLAQLERLFDHSVALDFLAAWNAPGFSDLVGPNVLATLAHLDQLLRAFDAADHPAAVLAAKSAAASLQQQLAEAQRAAAAMPQGSQQQRALLDACGRVGGVLQDLLAAVRDALADPSRRDALLAAVEAAKLLAGELAMLSHPAREPGMFDDDAMARATEAVHAALRDLLAAAQGADPAQLAGALRGLTEALARQAGLARTASAASRYPAQVAEIQGAFGKVQQALGGLVGLAKELAVRPGERTLVDGMQQALVGAHAVADDLARASAPFLDQMLGSVARLQAALAALQDAAQQGAQRLGAQLDEVREVATLQARLAADHGALRPSQREAIGAAAAEHLRALQALLADQPALLADPRRAAQQHQPAMRETALRLLDAVLRTSGAEGGAEDADADMLQLLARQAHRIDGLGHALERGVAAPQQQQKHGEVQATAVQCRQAVSDESLLLTLAARPARLRGDQRGKLLELASLLGDRLRDLLPSVAAGMQGDEAALRLLLSSVRSAASEGAGVLFSAAQLRGMMEREALHVAAAGATLLETPQLGAQQRDDVLAVLQHAEHLRHLAHAACKELVQDPRDRRELAQLADALVPIQGRIRDAADLLLRSQQGSAEAAGAQGELRGAVREARAAADKVVHKAYGSDVAQRLRDNGAALDKDLAQLRGHLQKGFQPEATALIPVAAARMARQKDLAGHALQHCTNPAAREPLRAALDRATGLHAPFASVLRSSAQDLQNPAVLSPALQLVDAARPAGTQLTELALSALQPAPPPAASGSEIVEITSLATAAQHMQVATEHLTFDDTPKGRLNRAAWNIAQGMKELADAAAVDDKKAMITAARKIASFTITLVQDATAVGAVCRDRRVVDQLISMARAGKNWSIQLKILCAVKASSSGRDETAESQLLTCATGLAQSVVQCVQEADVAELKHN